MDVPENLRYTSDHVWVGRDGDRLIVRITDFGQAALGDLVHIDPPEIGSWASAGAAIAEVESIKSVPEIYSPAAGTVVAVNDGSDRDRISRTPTRTARVGSSWSLHRVRTSKMTC